MSPDQLIKGVITELVLIIAAARIFGIAFRKFGLPQVCGEIAAGIALGPSIFGALFPGAAHYIFNPAFSQIFTALSQLGLVLLMFVIGLDFDFSHLRANGQTAIMVSIAGIAVPFCLGLVFAAAIYSSVGNGVDRISFSLFLAIALSITAIPTLGRIMALVTTFMTGPLLRWTLPDQPEFRLARVAG